MTLVVLIWLLQGGAVLYFMLRDADLAAFAARLGSALFNPTTLLLFGGIIGFMIAAGYSAANYDIPGGFAATASLVIQLGMMMIVILVKLFARGGRDLVFGSAQFATPEHAQQQGLLGESGIRLGLLRHPDPKERARLERDGIKYPLHYTGERHLLTVAPTRAGKGVSVIIPNLLTYQGSVITIDPKGENAIATHEARSKIGTAHVLDPWGIAGRAQARFNPLDLLTPDSPTLIEDALLIADALVVSDGKEPFWADEAQALIMGFILHIATAPEEAGQRHLGRLRDILTLPMGELAEIGMAMARSSHPVVVSSAARLIAKSDSERSGVFSTAQRNTHFLDSAALRDCLSASDFRFADLKGEQPVSVYVVLPVDRLATYSRWLRLLIAIGIADLARLPVKPKRPVLFLLDEFAQLGRLTIIEDAYGLMAGMGLQLHVIAQDLSQLHRLYGDGWQTFVGNAGVIQVFGTRDVFTADYVSKMLGVTTATVRSTSSGSGTGPDGKTTSNSSVSYAPTQRPLVFPDELMRMDRDAQVLFVENADPVMATKLRTMTQQLLGR